MCNNPLEIDFLNFWSYFENTNNYYLDLPTKVLTNDIYKKYHNFVLVNILSGHNKHI